MVRQIFTTEYTVFLGGEEGFFCVKRVVNKSRWGGRFWRKGIKGREKRKCGEEGWVWMFWRVGVWNVEKSAAEVGVLCR